MSIIELAPTIVTSILALAAAYVVFQRDRKAILNQSLAIFLVGGASWSLTSVVLQLPGHSVEYGLLISRLAFIESVVMSFALALFALSLSKKVITRSFWWTLLTGYFVLSLIAASGLVTASVRTVNDIVIVERGVLYVPFVIVLITGSLISIFYILRMYLQLAPSIEKQRYLVILLGLSAGISSAIMTNAVIPNIAGTSTSSRYIWIAILIWTIVLVYAVAKHGFLDIRVAAIRTLAYAGALMTLSGIYYLIAYLFSLLILGGDIASSVSVSPVNIFLALLLAFLFQPIKRFFDKLTNNIFYRDGYKSEEFFADLSQMLASTTELRGLLERASGKIATTLKAEQTFFFLHYTGTSHHHISAGTPHHSRIPVYDAKLLDEYINAHDDAIITVELLPEKSDLRRMLVSHKIALVMPLRYAENIVGYVCLGEQQGRGRGYAKRDFQVLSTIADELVIAIQNALSLHEIKEINATLQQRIDSATKELRSSNAQLRHLDEVKDEFMSMASHQLRTPLTSVKGYLSMVIEGDTGDITPQQRRVLEEAFNSSERMVRLIADFLNVSRLQTGKFVVEKTPTDIVKVVRDEVASLKIIAKTHNMKLVFQMPDAPLPSVALDEAKIRQVIMNFIDNAIYYSRPNTTVRVVLEQIDDDIAFRVIDTGIGVPLEEQPKLFNKFFRAKNARKQRPDGTGVGLYLAKKVVTAHKGKMIFNSEEGKGSTFGFRIPINQA